jgi:hypothetical protein
MIRGIHWIHGAPKLGFMQCFAGASYCRIAWPWEPFRVRCVGPPLVLADHANLPVIQAARWMNRGASTKTTDDASSHPDDVDNDAKQSADSDEISTPAVVCSDAGGDAAVAPKVTSLYPYPLHDWKIREREPIPTPKLPPLPPELAEKYHHVPMPEPTEKDESQLWALEGRIQQVEEAVPTGKNSYLQVDLYEQPFLQALHDMTCTIPAKLEDALQVHLDKGNQPPLQQLTGAYISQRLRKSRLRKVKHWIQEIICPNQAEKPTEKIVLPPLHIVPRPLSRLHCTLFFGGPTLVALSNDDLLQWHENVTRRLEQSGFILDGGAFPEHVQVHVPDDYWFHVTELSRFPPRGKRLIVAQLQASAAWHDLWQDLRNIACNEVPGLQKFMNFPAQRHVERWIPHITLADIYFSLEGKRIEEKILRQVLREWPVDSFDFIENMKCMSIRMAGPVPQPKPEENDGPPVLDWNFKFQNIRRGCN